MENNNECIMEPLSEKVIKAEKEVNGRMKLFDREGKSFVEGDFLWNSNSIYPIQCVKIEMGSSDVLTGTFQGFCVSQFLLTQESLKTSLWQVSLDKEKS
jgi:hypothetical protein